MGGGTAGLTVRPLVVRGEPGPVLVEVADSSGDLLVIGAGRRGLLTRIRRGQVRRCCLTHARCPVLAVPPSTLAQETSHGLCAWVFRHRELTMDQVLREWGSPAA